MQRLALCAGAVLSLGVVTLVVAPAMALAEEKVPLYDNLGDYSRTISTDSEQAQQYFNQGLRLGYGFAWEKAAASFRVAQEHDPECAMCYWGEAWTLGPYLNNPDGVGKAQDAARAAEAAVERVESVQPWERALIEAMAAHYGDGANEQEAAERYAEAMSEAAAEYPEDPEVRTLHAEALMIVRAEDLHEDGEEPYPETRVAIEELEAVLAEDLHHPGACHLYIHAVEEWEPARAEACSDGLADTMPGVSHIQHMPSHIYMNIGRYGDAVRANQKARIVDEAARHGEAVSVYAIHNTLMLIFAGWMDGQSAVALSAARDVARERPRQVFYYHLQLARFGRWDELLDQTAEPEEDFPAALWHFARGLAYLRTDDATAAQDALSTVRGIRDRTSDDATYGFIRQPSRDLLGIAQYILAGEIAAADGRLEEAQQALRRAIDLEDALEYSEPEPWPIPARHILGAILLEAGEYRDAEAAYREALAAHPDNGWSLLGLKQSLVARDRDQEAAEVAEKFQEAWKRADIWLPGSRF